MTPDASNDSWLQEYLVEVAERGVCTKIGCTTCGAREFREGLLAALERNRVDPPTATTGTVGPTEELASALTAVRPSHGPASKLEDAARWIVHYIWCTLGEERAQHELPALIAGTWAGEILAGMQAHEAQRREACQRHAEANDPEQVRQRREEKRQARQAAHQQRIEKKKLHDRLWRETHGGGAK